MSAAVRRRVRWRRASDDDRDWLVENLAADGDVHGTLRHLGPLGMLEGTGIRDFRIMRQDTAWAACIANEQHLCVPCGDPGLLAVAGAPNRRWRLAVSDRAAMSACLGDDLERPGVIVHDQVLMALADDSAVSSVPDLDVRLAEAADLDALAQLAVVLHVDDGFGPHPGRAGVAGYRDRMAAMVAAERLFVVGPVGAPIAKAQLSVASNRWGTQLAGIVVRATERGRGVAQALVSEVVRRSLEERPDRPITLHVRRANARAIAMYERVGFREIDDWLLAVRP
ncbi:MAG: GNAT family N-acetyltransferase [Nitriliruptorales bacterium]|nr:GNAT family N-acetyltransferase [Nitriliruptorales bacterium]